MNRRVLIVEDDEAMSVALRDGFTFEGYEVSVARNGEAGLAAAEAESPDLMILDVMLPRMSGLDVCRRLREGGHSLPIIMLTARGQEIDKVLGLRLGADDYVTKPFSFLELIARTEALLRRTSGHVAGERSVGTIRFGDVAVDFESHCARKGEAELDLSPREYQLLDFFHRHRGQVVTREQLLDQVWGYDAIPFTRTVDTHIAKLRK
ncbi:MAG: response regulator transcription factor, partial [Acidobacteria bacterium]|nr:response regulator transcription factor [Acidobacteriota bacterium]